MAFVLDLTFSSLLPVALLLLTLFIWFYASSKPQQRLPPSPPKFPVVGNLFQLGLYPHRKLQSLSRKYGSLMLVHFGSKPVVVASSADAACEIMRTHDLVFANRPKTSIFDRLLYGSKDIGASPYGEYWRQVRSICVLQLLSHKRVQSFRYVREEETSLIVEKITSFSASSPPLSAINLSDLLMTLTNDVICRVALGRKYSDREDGSKSMQIVKEFVELLGTTDIGDFVPWLGWLRHLNDLDDKVEKVVKQLDEFLEGVIKEHKDRKNGKANTDDGIEGKGSDLVDILLEIQGEKSTGFTLELDSLKAIILDMFAAGTDTTHTDMDWTMTEILEKLLTEPHAAALSPASPLRHPHLRFLPQPTTTAVQSTSAAAAAVHRVATLHTPPPASERPQSRAANTPSLSLLARLPTSTSLQATTLSSSSAQPPPARRLHPSAQPRASAARTPRASSSPPARPAARRTARRAPHGPAAISSFLRDSTVRRSSSSGDQAQQFAPPAEPPRATRVAEQQLSLRVLARDTELHRGTVDSSEELPLLLLGMDMGESGG
ncbi:cytochrome P450 71A3-like [Coffea eugenioides]|uniref:cytochrome P450 71A3-like n=1 Tax=Coffea eugenioides TaxID=49369 RepID=UPI000F60652E|nr:cytochrome P450 71A3-like [Coffea eugenioides]